MNRGAGPLFLHLKKWELIAQRDKEETEEILKLERCASPPPAFIDRLADDFLQADEMASFGLNKDWNK